jgi:hypothetical protein
VCYYITRKGKWKGEEAMKVQESAVALWVLVLLGMVVVKGCGSVTVETPVPTSDIAVTVEAAVATALASQLIPDLTATVEAAVATGVAATQAAQAEPIAKPTPVPPTATVDTGLNPPTDDADGDGLTNLEEYHNGTNPNNPDTDGDGMPDSWEVTNDLDPLADDAGGDADGDRLTNLDEYAQGTNASNPDTDADGMPDGWEVDNSLDPTVDDTSGDPDNDGLSNAEEFNKRTNPFMPNAVVNVENLLNLRSGPGTNHDIIEKLKQGDCLEVMGKNTDGDWLKVIAPNGQEGWVDASLLEINFPLDGVPVAQATPMPIPTHMPIPVAAPIPELLPPPIPLEPENGASFIGEPVLLRWQWDRPRAPNEVFSVRVRREGETRVCHHAQAKDLEYKGSLTYCTAGTHYWSVALVRDLAPWLPEDDENRWQDLSEPSEERWIYYVPPEEPWTWPIPTPSGGGNGDGPCPGCRP